MRFSLKLYVVEIFCYHGCVQRAKIYKEHLHLSEKYKNFKNLFPCVINPHCTHMGLLSPTDFY